MRTTKTETKLRELRSIDDLLQVEKMIIDNLDRKLGQEGVDLRAYFKAIRQRHVWFLLTKLRFLWARYFEVFVWEEGGKVIATGSARRLNFDDMTRWALGNFAVSTGARSELALLLTLRKLSRRCVAHALVNGAKEILADIPIENEALARGLQHDGFKIIDILCYFGCPSAALGALGIPAVKHGQIGFKRATPAGMPRWMEIAAARLLGLQSRSFEARLDQTPIARIELVSHPGSPGPRIMINPCAPLPVASAMLLLASLTDMLPQASDRIVVVVPRSSESLFGALNQAGIAEISRRNRLCLPVAQKDG